MGIELENPLRSIGKAKTENQPECPYGHGTVAPSLVRL
jgi:hypothetical protein